MEKVHDSRAKLEAATTEQDQISFELLDLLDKSKSKHKKLKEYERQLSEQAGQLLNALQREEARANKVSGTVRKTRHVRKKLLARIKNPRWEVKHHYHMTCMEHALGHAQPHVIDVGEMLPGHLRLFAIARRTILYQKMLIFSLTRAKNERNKGSEHIKEAYYHLRVVRAEIKDVEKILETLRQQSHLLSTSSGNVNVNVNVNVNGNGNGNGNGNDNGNEQHSDALRRLADEVGISSHSNHHNQYHHNNTTDNNGIGIGRGRGRGMMGPGPGRGGIHNRFKQNNNFRNRSLGRGLGGVRGISANAHRVHVRARYFNSLNLKPTKFKPILKIDADGKLAREGGDDSDGHPFTWNRMNTLLTKLQTQSTVRQRAQQELDVMTRMVKKTRGGKSSRAMGAAMGYKAVSGEGDGDDGDSVEGDGSDDDELVVSASFQKGVAAFPEPLKFTTVDSDTEREDSEDEDDNDNENENENDDNNDTMDGTGRSGTRDATEGKTELSGVSADKNDSSSSSKRNANNKNNFVQDHHTTNNATTTTNSSSSSSRRSSSRSNVSDKPKKGTVNNGSLSRSMSRSDSIDDELEKIDINIDKAEIPETKEVEVLKALRKEITGYSTPPQSPSLSPINSKPSSVQSSPSKLSPVLSASSPADGGFPSSSRSITYSTSEPNLEAHRAGESMPKSVSASCIPTMSSSSSSSNQRHYDGASASYASSLSVSSSLSTIASSSDHDEHDGDTANAEESNDDDTRSSTSIIIPEVQAFSSIQSQQASASPHTSTEKSLSSSTATTAVTNAPVNIPQQQSILSTMSASSSSPSSSSSSSSSLTTSSTSSESAASSSSSSASSSESSESASSRASQAAKPSSMSKFSFFSPFFFSSKSRNSSQANSPTGSRTGSRATSRTSSAKNSPKTQKRKL